jgi:hypothetical protein
MADIDRVDALSGKIGIEASVRVVRAVTVGVGLFSSSWVGLPVAPAFSVPGEWTDLSGTGWRQQIRTVTFTGVSISVGVGF